MCQKCKEPCSRDLFRYKQIFIANSQLYIRKNATSPQRRSSQPLYQKNNVLKKKQLSDTIYNT